MRRIPWKFLLAAGLIILGILNFSTVVSWFRLLWQAVFPLVMGGVLAFILNLIMKPCAQFLEKKHVKAAGPLALFAAFCVAVLLIAALSLLVIPQLVESAQILVKTVPGYVEDTQKWLVKVFAKYPQITDYINSLQINWDDVFKKTLDFLGSGMQGALNSAVSVVSNVVSTVVNSIIVVIFAVYLLSDKERFIRLYHRLCRLYLSEENGKKLTHVLNVFYDSFRAFVGGQCLEAVILGVLCVLGMMVLRLPYAAMIGTLVGVINIIPMIGAFIGGGIGCFLVFTVSPWKALVFLIFLCVLQQIESNVFYPRIVGKSIGLPGIYVTMVVVIGGSLAGIPGMLIGIPLAAALYRLAKEHVMHAEREAGLEPFDSSGQEKSPKPSSRL